MKILGLLYIAVFILGLLLAAWIHPLSAIILLAVGWPLWRLVDRAARPGRTGANLRAGFRPRD